MEYHRISFIHNDTEYSFIKAINGNLTGYALMSACRIEVVNYMKENNNPEFDTYIFLSKKGVNRPITRQQAYRIINNAAELLGIVERNDKGNLIHGEIGTHTLRKTFGYHSFQNGTSLELLMDLFNHSSKTQTLRYIGITEDQKKEVYLKSNLG